MGFNECVGGSNVLIINVFMVKLVVPTQAEKPFHGARFTMTTISILTAPRRRTLADYELSIQHLATAEGLSAEAKRLSRSNEFAGDAYFKAWSLLFARAKVLNIPYHRQSKTFRLPSPPKPTIGQTIYLPAIQQQGLVVAYDRFDLVVQLGSGKKVIVAPENAQALPECMW